MGLPVVAVDKLSAQVHSKHERPSALDPAADLIVADICERAVWDRILSSYRPVTIIHLCAETGTAQSLTSSTLHASTNVVGTSEMLDALVRHDAIPSLFVLSSSRAVYGEGQWGAADGSLFYPFRRSHEQLSRGQWDPVGPDGKAGHPLPHSAATTMPLPTSIYGATKLAQEHMIAAWCSAFGTDLTAFRIQNAYGVGQSPINSYTGIINIFHKIAASKQPIDVYEDGNIGRDFIYISDVAEAIVAAAKVHLRGIEIIDLGTGRLTSIHEAAKIIARLAWRARTKNQRKVPGRRYPIRLRRPDGFKKTPWAHPVDNTRSRLPGRWRVARRCRLFVRSLSKTHKIHKADRPVLRRALMV